MVGRAENQRLEEFEEDTRHKRDSVGDILKGVQVLLRTRQLEG